MRIIDILRQEGVHISFEVFPPKTDAGYGTVLHAVDDIGALKPAFISVTYGAGGGTSKNTVNIAAHIKDDAACSQSGTSDLCVIDKAGGRKSHQKAEKERD